MDGFLPVRHRLRRSRGAGEAAPAGSAGGAASRKVSVVTGSRAALVAVAAPLFAALLLGLVPEPAWAHGVSLGQSKIRQEGDTVRYKLAVEHDQLVKRVSTTPSGPSPPTLTDAERETELLGLRAKLAAYLERGVRVSLDGDACAARLETIEVERFQGTAYAVLTSTYRCPGPSGALEVEYELFFDALSDAERSSHANVADYDVGGETGRFVFESDARRLTAGGEGLLDAAGRFVTLGFQHILGGLDHVLFVIALLLGARNVRTILKVVTAFTVAHSLTLVAAAMGWLVVSPSIVEPVIALSIVCVAIQNIIQTEPRHRLVLVFAFGLLHGLGFAGSISFADETSWRLITSLLAFNFGIEAGQASVILLTAPLLFLVRRRRWSRSAQWTASAVIALSGLLWFVGRLPFS